jgi:integrase
VHICHNLKTESSDRVLTLPEALNEALCPAIDRLQSDDDLLFPIASVTLQQRFRKYVEKAGVKPIRIHDLRHSFATNLINSGANIVAVSKYLGHANINQTLKTYTHLLKSTDERLVQSVNEMMKNA